MSAFWFTLPGDSPVQGHACHSLVLPESWTCPREAPGTGCGEDGPSPGLTAGALGQLPLTSAQPAQVLVASDTAGEAAGTQSWERPHPPAHTVPVSLHLLHVITREG